MDRLPYRALLALITTSVLAACAGGAATPVASTTEVAAPTGIQLDIAEPVVIYASPTCGCCHDYAPYLENHGLTVDMKITEDTEGVKERYGIPQEAWSCHTAVIGDYFIEGHVPVEAIQKLLEEAPDIDGIALPGMPLGSPGMNGEKAAPFEVVAIADGRVEPFLSV